MPKDFKLEAEFKPTGDQPEAIRQLVEGLNQGVPYQTLLGVTGSGKTFTMANVIAQVNRPMLVLSHNKTLAAQLYGEFKQFFPKNAVEYFVSYYDYYQPEAYLPATDTFIEKDMAINDEIEKLRLSATTSLLSGRRDVLIVSSVSCIYGIGNPEEFRNGIIYIKKGQLVSRNKFLLKLVESLYSRNDLAPERGNFRVKGDTIDVFLAYVDTAVRIIFWGDEIEEIYTFDHLQNRKLEVFESFEIFPANIFVTSQETINGAIGNIEIDLGKHVEFMKSQQKILEAKRIEDRVTYDLEMIRELGYCSGIENYSRYFDGREPGTRPFCLLDYFPDDFILMVDESHATIPQIRGMYAGDRSRKQNLVEYGFRLPAAMDNRPLKFEEFESITGQTVYVSATPSEYELENSEGVVVEQLIRPTGLLDPEIEVRPSLNQIDDLIEEIQLRIERDERTLVTTLTKRMAEELQKYLDKVGIPCRYIHSEVETMERVEILRQLRLGVFPVLVGVNLLREGLDLPEVSLVAIIDADKEGFLRSERSLVQTVGRAARNINGKVIMYADKITDSMKKTISETNRRRDIQREYNTDHNMVPTQIKKSKESILAQTKVADSDGNSRYGKDSYAIVGESMLVEDPVIAYMTKDQLQAAITNTRKQMEKASGELDFIEAARLRDEMFMMELKLRGK